LEGPSTAIRTRLEPAIAGLPALLRASLPTILGVAAAIAAVGLTYLAGFVDDFGATLQIMGFDPDRATLITAMLDGAIGGAVVAAFGGRFVVAVVTGAAAMVVSFSGVFREETRLAIASRGSDGVFDPVGWALSVLTIGVAAIIVGWAAAELTRDVRRRLGLVRAAVIDLLGPRTKVPGDLGRIGATAVALVLLVVTFPILGDMLNFEPDSHMRSGGPAGVALFGGSDGSTPSSAPTASAPVAGTVGPGGLGNARGAPPKANATPGPLVVPPDLVPGPVSGASVTAGVLATSRPWATTVPRGGGRTLSVNLPAPWTGGTQSFATIDIYLPPGYDAGTRHYPTIYEPHQPLWAWQQGMHVVSLLDDLIRSGTIPPEIVVFVGQAGGPYPDSECANSYDGKEWFDTYLGHDVPAYVDAHFRTIPTVAARALLGFSAGGYCAAAAIAHHPDVFGSALIFSGYFDAGILTSTTPNAGRPFNNDAALEATVSPIDVVPHLPAAQRHAMFLAFSADPANRFYGDQITAFAGVLDAVGVPMAILPTPLGHSWAAVREQLPDMLAMLAERQVMLGVFGPG
jgi:enterochelin esterase-like enzyme